MEKMSPKEYLQTQIELVEIGARCERLDIQAFLKCISHAEATAPFIDPTLYRRAAANLTAVKKLAEAILPVKKAFDECYGTLIHTAIQEQNDAPQPPPPSYL